VATVRRRGSSIYDQIGTYDMTTDEVYFERGVSRRHGYLTEYYVDAPEYIVRAPDGVRDIDVLAEPLSVAEKGIIQAFEIQRRLRVWQPRKAAVLGTGTIGLLATLIVRLRGIEVTTFGRTLPPYLKRQSATWRWPRRSIPAGLLGCSATRCMAWRTTAS
jgi:glucose 1-dehydrogenase